MPDETGRRILAIPRENARTSIAEIGDVRELHRFAGDPD
jgi:hypothetical protein